VRLFKEKEGVMEVLGAIWSQITLKDIADIIIVAILIYQILLVVHGTRAVQMLLGVGALSVLFWAGTYYELYSLTWILQHFFNSVFIIVVIVFQDQIRNALATFGTGQRLLSRASKEGHDDKISEVVDACAILSKNRIGALIVFERHQGLMNYMKGGTMLDCHIHADLLYSIFWPSSPLHDGAVIISQNRIGAAGCFLPLSKNLDLDKHYGTRHRAALGLSEVTDAIVVVVSEESGRITVCRNGTTVVVANSTELFSTIKSLWSADYISTTAKRVMATGDQR